MFGPSRQGDAPLLMFVVRMPTIWSGGETVGSHTVGIWLSITTVSRPRMKV